MPDRNTKLVETAAEWWVRQLDIPVQDNGDSAQSVMGTLLAGFSGEIPDSVKEQFKYALMDILRKRIEELGVGYRIHLFVDYGPDALLSRAVEAVDDGYQGSLCNRLPWKTDMIVEADGVRASRGYGAQYEDVPEWELSS